jgi:hypothetical protein
MKNLTKLFGFNKESIIVLGVLIVLSITLFSIGDGGITVDITDYESEEIANVSYVLSGVLTMYTSINGLSETEIEPDPPLSDIYPTEFVKYIEEFNHYFDTTRVFIDHIDILGNHTFEKLNDSEYEYKISYTLDNQLHDFYFTQYKTQIEGKLVVGENEYPIEGSLEEDSNVIGIQLSVKLEGNGNYVDVGYSNEIRENGTKMYHVTTIRNYKSDYMQIMVAEQVSGTNIVLMSNQADYTISRSISLEDISYHVDYFINGIDGTVEIIVTLDEFGQEIFSYTIYGDDEVVELTLFDPDENNEN